MSIKKIKGFKLYSEDIALLAKLAKKFVCPETTIVEVALKNFSGLSESKQRELIADYLTRKL